MSSQPTLSVVLPVKNAELYIGEALTSLRLNARPDYEFIVIDDGSDDDTTAIIDDARAVLPQMQVIRHDEAVGLASARNVGLAAATGRLITYMDGDDWLEPGYLPRLVEMIDGLACDFVRVDHIQVSNRARTPHYAPEPRRDVVLSPRDGIAELNHSTMIDYPYAWAGIYRRELRDLLEFPAGLHTAEDRPWIWRLHREAQSYAVASFIGLFYRRMVAQSLTQIGDARQLDFVRSFEMVLDQVRDEPENFAKATKQFLVVIAHHLRRSERFDVATTREMRRRVRPLLADIPPEILNLARLDARRQFLVRSVLPDTARRRLVG